MNNAVTPELVRWLQKPPFQFPATVNGNIPSPKFIQERKAQLNHLVNELGCLPLQHHIAGMRLWLRIDPSDGGGVGFSLDLDTVMAFVKYTARTMDNLVQHRVSNDQKFMKWVTDRVSGLPLEERRFLGFDEPHEPIEASAPEQPSQRRRSTRIPSGDGVAVVSILKQSRVAVDQPLVEKTAQKHRRVTFTNPEPFAANNQPTAKKCGVPTPKNISKDGGEIYQPQTALRASVHNERKMHCDGGGTDKTYKGKGKGKVDDDDILDTIVVAGSTGTSESFWKSGTSTGTEMNVSSASACTPIYRKPAGDFFPKDKPITEGSQAPDAKTRARVRSDRKPSTVRVTAEEPKPHSNIGARRSSRVTVIPTTRGTRQLPNSNGPMIITIVFDGRVTTFLEMVQNMEGVESTKRVTATIINIRVKAESYLAIYSKLSRTLGVASISSSPNV
ncbi:hypothetical protein L211DRAFT_850511 [Terfezia boudieri ATCC MYA-4762]|uniref:Uncharacterized protein n=1 Tax=Terfezia boudieri ATCC MYA-4762 TaxID=1051890 RepID=A0A3N4LP69_9PEZI|nr:hypothetical protein L211DRAFT_850511 [Terfezia boudieri ATCC MYA-4762]